MATTARRSNLEIVESAYEGFNSGNIGDVLATFDDDIEWVEPMGARYSGSHHGPEAIAEEVFAGTASDYEGFQATPHRYVDGGDTVVVLGEITGTVRETGEEIAVPFAHVCELEDGRMVRFTDYHDTETVQQAFGN
ncbi:nuclear transport factor 2 family protein [Salinirubellus sp. GCM10025818]|uniref:nuclear transport factor 2 family protein n=1 Tax=Salinirubellus TaxID=2162630 RepID=UPI0030D22868